MHGNAQEWCWDRYGEYPKNSVKDPKDPATGKHRVIRGGSCILHPNFCRSACRQADGSGALYVGFRVVLPVELEAKEDAPIEP